ncbi:carboxymuconolactone decarboxylase family protein [Thermodesulfobacteriota bacterium]
MAIIQTVSPEKAEGETKKIYDIMLQNVGVVPSPLQLASASPGILNFNWESIKYYSQHPTLGFALLSTIRFLVSEHLNYAFCRNFNKNILKKQGLSDEDIDEMIKDPLKTPLEDKEQAMLGFVMKAIKTPDSVEQQDMDKLHDMGWKDRDILDSLVHGTNMVGSSILLKTFKMDVVC